ncbi:uncharacterized protein B0I36DRAFT_319463 [Microdochium trichocladiopsis]|uniref:Methyltransferase type 11 domain-containing protein n=1 Tax=Microdochium trichocladiopsis TaxID=1682393 RepID=A0A9P9BTH4_9PEZI|nr:uncharacterized protein B0I36DRAFT_319463 [Microdochium trichocladiopsis]KAH7035970.1 hypothetical protein B0I36DRAFT_319463 [Microdochium trichocladiopsis]
MAGVDEENERLAHADYWDGRYAETQATASDQQLHEWFRSAQDLEDFFTKHLYTPRPPPSPSPSAAASAAASDPLILHLGSGDSLVPQHLAAKGYRNQLCVDFSHVVVETMAKRHADLGLLDTAIRWQQMDVRAMASLGDGSVDVAFDKGTLDAMIHGSPWSPPQDTLDNTSAYLREVSRILNKSGGVFLYVTYRQPHFVRPLLTCDGTNWDLEVEHLGAGDGSFGYYGIVCRPRVAET